jgi:plastocyanin
MRHTALALPLACLVIVSACGSAATPASPTPSAAAPRVEYKGFKANPMTLEVAKGTTVTWTNSDPTAHTVTSGTNRQSDGKFDGEIGQGETFTFTFQQAGTFEYFCMRHASMVGFKVVVR